MIWEGLNYFISRLRREKHDHIYIYCFQGWGVFWEGGEICVEYPMIQKIIYGGDFEFLIFLEKEGWGGRGGGVNAPAMISIWNYRRYSCLKVSCPNDVQTTAAQEVKCVKIPNDLVLFIDGWRSIARRM